MKTAIVGLLSSFDFLVSLVFIASFSRTAMKKKDRKFFRSLISVPPGYRILYLIHIHDQPDFLSGTDHITDAPVPFFDICNSHIMFSGDL